MRVGLSAVVFIGVLLLVGCENRQPRTQDPASDLPTAQDREDLPPRPEPPPEEPRADEPDAEEPQAQEPETDRVPLPDPEPDTQDTVDDASAQPQESASPAEAERETPPSQPSKIRGQLNLIDRSRESVAQDEAFAQTVVYFVPDSPVAPPPPGEYEVGTRAKRFEPDVIVVPAGSTVNFPNYDRILHNVFSLSDVAEFDLGFYGHEESRSVVFDKPGLALIHCNVHQSMQAEIFVVETPYYTKPDIDGRFELTGISQEQGSLHIWNPRSGDISQAVSLSGDQMLNIDLELTRPRIEEHVNKFGEPY